MFRLSKGAEYAIRGVLYLSLQPRGKVAYIDEVCKDQDVPKAYLAKIFQTLSKKGLLISTRGPGGGFTLAKPPSEISVLDVVEAMEGPVRLNVCLIHKGYCERDKTCAVHDFWQEAQKVFLGFFSGRKFSDLAVAARKKQSKARRKPADA